MTSLRSWLTCSRGLEDCHLSKNQSSSPRQLGMCLRTDYFLYSSHAHKGWTLLSSPSQRWETEAQGGNRSRPH